MNTKYLKERIIAYLIDYFMIFFIMTLGLIFLTIITAFDPDMTVDEFMVIQQLYMFISFFLISLGYFSVSEWRTGTTLGKMICIIGVKNESGQESEGESKISYKQSFVRNFSKCGLK